MPFHKLPVDIPIVLQDANPNQQLARYFGRSSFAKARNRVTIPALLLNQNAHIACNLLVIPSHLEVRWVYVGEGNGFFRYENISRPFSSQ